VSFALILGGCLLATAAQHDQPPTPQLATPAEPGHIPADQR
jgi:hypothetical protein